MTTTGYNHSQQKQLVEKILKLVHQKNKLPASGNDTENECLWNVLINCNTGDATFFATAIFIKIGH